MPPPRHRRCFSLIELLMVVSIIAILAGLLLPVLTKAREKARQITCASGLKQLDLAAIMYANDHQGSFPDDRGPFLTYAGQYQRATSDWRRLYTRDYHPRNDRLWACPSAPVPSVDGSLANYYYRAYGYTTGDNSSSTKTVAVDDYASHQQLWTNAAFIDGHVEGRKYPYYPFLDDTLP